MIGHLARRGQIPALIETIKRQRPDLHQRIDNRRLETGSQISYR